ncbi:MAG: ribbon-helix-helix protein, CopG family, partial [Moorea sp. SIO3I7]|nr:ribbon-helix-helix protein, CopG family [Moorena sp. SIO3I7]
MSRKLVSFRLSEDLAQALKDRAEEKGISVTELINRLLRQGLETDDSVEERLTVVQASVDKLRKQTNVTDLALAIQGVAQSLGVSPVPKTDSNLERRLDELQE